MPLPLRFVPRASCLSTAYLLSVYEDCDWFCMAWRAGSGNRCCFPSWIGFEMDMHCIMDSSSGSLRCSLCVSFVIVCEDCAVSLLCWVRSVCFPFLSCTSSLSVCSWLFALFPSWCLSSACLCQRLLCMCCACAVPVQCIGNSPAIHLLCIFSACPFQQTPLKSTLPTLPLASSSSFAIPAARW